MLLRQGMVKKTTGTTALSLLVPGSRSIRMRDLYCMFAAAAAEDITVTVDRRKQLQFIAASGQYLLARREHDGYFSIFEELRRAGVALDIPVGPGMEIEITAPGTNNTMEMVYDEFDAPDVRDNEHNGAKADTYTLLQVISNSAIVTAAGDWALDQSDLDTAFPAFPGGKVVPAKTMMTLTHLFGGAAAKGDATDDTQRVTHLRFLREREDLFDTDLTGMMFEGDIDTVAAAPTYHTANGRISCGEQYQRPRVLALDPPIVFEAGQELNVFATVAEEKAATGDFAAGEIKLGLAFRVERHL